MTAALYKEEFSLTLLDSFFGRYKFLTVFCDVFELRFQQLIKPGSGRYKISESHLSYLSRILEKPEQYLFWFQER